MGKGVGHVRDEFVKQLQMTNFVNPISFYIGKISVISTAMHCGKHNTRNDQKLRLQVSFVIGKSLGVR